MNLIFTLLLCFSTSFAVGVAVLDFEPVNLDSGDVKMLTEKFRSEVSQIQGVELIERSAVNLILEEQGFQQSGCTDQNCIVQVGKLIGVQKLITGKIGRVGNSFSVFAKIIDVETGRIEKSSEEIRKGGVEILLAEGIAICVDQLFSQYTIQKKVNKNGMGNWKYSIDLVPNILFTTLKSYARANDAESSLFSGNLNLLQTGLSFEKFLISAEIDLLNQNDNEGNGIYLMMLGYHQLFYDANFVRFYNGGKIGFLIDNTKPGSKSVSDLSKIGLDALVEFGRRKGGIFDYIFIIEPAYIYPDVFNIKAGLKFSLNR